MKLGQILAVNYLRARLNLLAVISPTAAAKKAFAIFCTPFYKSGRETPAIFNEAEEQSILVKGNTIRGYRWNRGGIKKVLILHGFESSCKNFDAYIKLLIEKNYEVLAFDAPAHGSSGGKHITLPLYIEMIAAIHFQFGIIQSFIAHSFGGLAFTHFIEKIPVDAHTRLALIAPATEINTAIDSLFRFLQLGGRVRKAFDQIIQTKSGVSPAHISIPRALQNNKATVLWVHDRQDNVTPYTDLEPVMRKNYDNVSFLITDGLGHKKIYRNNRVIQAVTDFVWLLRRPTTLK